MKIKLLDQINGLRSFAVVFATSDEPIGGLRQFAATHGVTGAQLTGIGAFERLTVGYFDWATKSYRKIAFDEQVEVLSLTGNIGLEGNAPKLHVHLVVGKSDGTAHGGHLLEARVRPTLEVIVLETPKHLQRTFDEETGLSLIDLSR